MVDPDAEIVEASDSQTGRHAALAPRARSRPTAARFQGIAGPQGAGASPRPSPATRPRRSGWARSSATRRSSRGSTACAASSIRVDGPGWVDSLVTVLTDPYVSWLLLFVGAVHAGDRAQAAGHRPAGDHLGPGVPAVLLEPLPQRHRRPARDHPVPGRAWSAWRSSSSSSPASASSA